jgi:hypothetical protein
MAWVGGSTYSPTTSRQLVDKFRIVRELELPHAMRLKPVGAPDALNRTDRDARDLCHQRAGPVRRLAGRIIERQGDNSCGDFIAQRFDAGRRRLVTQQAFKPFRGETLLPAPDAGLRLAGLAHDCIRARAAWLSRTISACHTCFCGALRSLTRASSRRRSAGKTVMDIHAAGSHTASPAGIPNRIQMSDLIH